MSAKRSVGKRKSKITQFYANRYPEKKLRNILDSQGLKAAKIWADKNLCTSLLESIVKGRSSMREEAANVN